MRTDGVSGPLSGQLPTRSAQPSRPTLAEAQAEEPRVHEQESPDAEPVVLRMVPTPAERQALPSQAAAKALAGDLSTMIARHPSAAIEAQGARLDEERVERLLA